MPQTLATLTPILKEVYEGGLNDQLNNEVKAWKRIQSTSRGTQRSGGKYVDFPIHIGRNSGIGSRDEMDPLPNAGRQKTAEAHLALKYHYASIELTGQAIELADKDYQSFAAALDMEVSRIKDDVSKERNRQFFGTYLGTRATAAGAVSGQDLVVDNARLLDMDGVYDIMTGATSTVRRADVVVSNINYATNTVTFTGTMTGVTTGDIIVRADSYGHEIHGLADILNNSHDLYDVAALAGTSVPVWAAEVKSSVGTISEIEMIRMADRIYTNGGRTTVMWTTLGIQREYFSLLTGDRRFVNTQKFEGGFSGLAFQSGSQGEVPLIADIDAPLGQIAYINEKEIAFYKPHDFKFMDRTGSMWQQKRDSNGKYDAYEATLYEYSEMGTRRRNTHGALTGVTEDTL